MLDEQARVLGCCFVGVDWLSVLESHFIHKRCDLMIKRGLHFYRHDIDGNNIKVNSVQYLYFTTLDIKTDIVDVHDPPFFWDGAHRSACHIGDVPWSVYVCIIGLIDHALKSFVVFVMELDDLPM